MGLLPFVRGVTKGGRAAINGIRGGSEIAQGLTKAEELLPRRSERLTMRRIWSKNADELGDGEKGGW